MTPQDDRLREHPSQRFSPSEDEIDLATATQHLLSEHEANRHGHRQIALFKGDAETLALFHFNAGGRFPDHSVDGTVIIQVLEGRLTVTTDQAAHALESGQLLRLRANVRHDVTAQDESRMLLTVFLNR